MEKTSCSMMRVSLMAVMAVLWCLVLQMDMYSAMTIDINPKRFKGGIQTDVKVSCSLDSAEAAAKEIVMLKISRKGEKAIAIIHPNNSITYVNGNPTEFPAKGTIDKGSIKNSYLNLTISEPLPEDSGAYSCNIFFIDEMGSLVEAKASGYLTVDDPALQVLKDTVRDLAFKVNKGEKLILTYKTMAEDYKKKVDVLEMKSNLQSKQISNMAQQGQTPGNSSNTTDKQTDILTDLLNRETQYKQKVAEIMAKFALQDKKVSNMVTKETQYKAKISAMEAKADLQDKQVSNLKQQMGQLSTKVDDATIESGKIAGQVSTLVKSKADLDSKVADAVQKADDVASKLKGLKTGGGGGGGGANPMIAFSATNQNKYIQAKTGSIIIFPDVILQEGQGYDTQSGVFTAPEDGLYAFHLVLKLSCVGCSVRVQLIADLQVLAKLKIGMSGDEHQGSLSAVVRLKKGAEAYTMVDFATARALLTMSQMSVFTGYLVNAG